MGWGVEAHHPHGTHLSCAKCSKTMEWWMKTGKADTGAASGTGLFPPV